MPQFDQSSFLNQVFWLFFFLTDFYMVIVYWWLPISCTILKFRKKKIYQNQIDLTALSLEHCSQNLFGVKISQQNLLHSDEILKQISKKTIDITTFIQNKWVLNSSIQNCLSNFWINMSSYPKHFK